MQGHEVDGKRTLSCLENRIAGTNYNIWHKEYNNTITGESYDNLVYPEFKGYHANVYWATLESDEVPFTIYSRTDGIFYRIFTPVEPKYSAKKTMPDFPEGDISFCLISQPFARLSLLNNRDQIVSLVIFA